MKDKRVLNRLWEFIIKHQEKIMQFFQRKTLNNQTAFGVVTGKNHDVSKYLDFEFYNLVLYFLFVHPSNREDNCALSQWTGISHQIGSNMCYCIMTRNGTPIAETTVQHIMRDNILDEHISKNIIKFNDTHDTCLGNLNFFIPSMREFTLEDNYYQTP